MRETIFIIVLYVVIMPLFMLLLSFLFRLNFIAMLIAFITFRVFLYIMDKLSED